MIISVPFRSPAPIRARPDVVTALAPALEAGLEEVCVEGASGVAAGLGFLLSAAGEGICRGGLMVAAPRVWLRERGRLLAGGLARLGLGDRTVLMTATTTEIEALWALEEGLRSGAMGLAVGAVEAASLLSTRRLDLAARAAGATVVLIKTRPARDLSAARRRWRVTPHPSAPHPFDPKASGAPRWRVTLERSRDGASGAWILEHDLETHRLCLVERLADHSLDLGEQDERALRRSG
jgi:protein ImuA